MNAEVIDSQSLISRGANYQRVARYSKPGLSLAKQYLKWFLVGYVI